MVEKPNEKINADILGNDRLLALSVQIISSYVGHNTVAAADLPLLMNTIYQNLAHLSGGSPALPKQP